MTAKQKSVNKASFKYLISFFIILVVILTFSLLAQNNFIKTHFKNFFPPSSKIKKQAQILRPTNIRIPILLYHYVEYVKDKKDTARQDLDTTPAIFEMQIATLKNAGFTFILASDVADILDGKKPAPKNPILITFDDGYADFYTDAYPILKKYGAKATIYVVPGLINDKNYLTLKQLINLSKNENIEIGAHTISHAVLKNTTIEKVKYEVLGSKEMLEDMLGIEIVSFAYPYGDFDNQAIEIVKNAGFKTATSTILGVVVNETNRYLLHRMRPAELTGKHLVNYLRNEDFKN
ncbi:MAG: hypothetical protein COU27_00655 [Candidatus Levybacteria bacterium CG10_big_fil_rev_8_21_14_0_10_36_7]|nr:MAG: hypothetical protein COU27_00655 [Candidatus Levybacteria bacterium CG10_big_fil_rev_8_21_14_0_10_36_7]